jgi:hypothetical protein
VHSAWLLLFLWPRLAWGRFDETPCLLEVSGMASVNALLPVGRRREKGGMEAWGVDERRFAGLSRRHRDRDSTAVVREGGQVREVTVHDS